MDPSHRSLAPSNPPLPMPRQSKMILQRQYRASESECFNTLREVIHELTGEEPQTRQETLRKAIDLLVAALEIRKSRETQVTCPAPYETPTDATSIHIGYSAKPSSSFPENWESTVEFGVQPTCYAPQPYGQSHDLMFNVDPAVNQGSSQGYGQNWST